MLKFAFNKLLYQTTNKLPSTLAEILLMHISQIKKRREELMTNSRPHGPQGRGYIWLWEERNDQCYWLITVDILFLVAIVNVGQRSITFKKGFKYVHIKAKCCPLLLYRRTFNSLDWSTARQNGSGKQSSPPSSHSAENEWMTSGLVQRASAGNCLPLVLMDHYLRHNSTSTSLTQQ